MKDRDCERHCEHRWERRSWRSGAPCWEPGRTPQRPPACPERQVSGGCGPGAEGPAGFGHVWEEARSREARTRGEGASGRKPRPPPGPAEVAGAGGVTACGSLGATLLPGTRWSSRNSVCEMPAASRGCWKPPPRPAWRQLSRTIHDPPSSGARRRGGGAVTDTAAPHPDSTSRSFFGL